MVRPETDRNEFELEVLKMSAKQKYGETSKTDEATDEPEDREAEKLVEREEAKSRMVYDKSTYTLDPSKMRATDYKYNRYVTLPKPGCPQTEAMHEMRRKELLSAFDKFKLDKRSGSSNLSQAEVRGLKSLQKRVASGELIVTETDKSKRFCVLRKNQYVEAGRKHVEKDVVVSSETVSY